MGDDDDVICLSPGDDVICLSPGQSVDNSMCPSNGIFSTFAPQIDLDPPEPLQLQPPSSKDLQYAVSALRSVLVSTGTAVKGTSGGSGTRTAAIEDSKGTANRRSERIAAACKDTAGGSGTGTAACTDTAGGSGTGTADGNSLVSKQQSLLHF